MYCLWRGALFRVNIRLSLNPSSLSIHKRHKAAWALRNDSSPVYSTGETHGLAYVGSLPSLPVVTELSDRFDSVIPTLPAQKLPFFGGSHNSALRWTLLLNTGSTVSPQLQSPIARKSSNKSRRSRLVSPKTVTRIKGDLRSSNIVQTLHLFDTRPVALQCVSSARLRRNFNQDCRQTRDRFCVLVFWILDVYSSKERQF